MADSPVILGAVTDAHRELPDMTDKLRLKILAALGVLPTLGTLGCQPTTEEVKPQGGLYDGVDADGDGEPSGEDCNDNDSSIHTGAHEICNDVDDNCNGEVDEGVQTTFYRDEDGDGHGAADDTIEACDPPEGYTANNTDCDDSSALALPGGVEVCDDLDNDCNGEVDEIIGWWPDDDGDGFGNGSGEGAPACDAPPPGYADNREDCDDTNDSVYPTAPEICHDGLDNDCDGTSSCLTAELVDLASGEACSVTWEITGANALSGTTPCAGCSFEFTANMDVVVDTRGDGRCAEEGDYYGMFAVGPEAFWTVDERHIDGTWSAPGSWDDNRIEFFSSAYLATLGGGYFEISYSGELFYDDVEYYYGYYYYEGRPFTVGGSARMADVTASPAWVADVDLDPSRLSEPTRARLVAAWTRAGRAEHASVASFARFSLELMALGAPPELLAASTRAMADEVAHARDCLGVASALAGRTIGVGPLDVSSAMADTTPEGVLERLLTEGCVDETVSAAIAAAARDGAVDPAIKAVLTRITEDEARHAVLAWQAARWLLGEHPHLRPLAHTILTDATRDLPDTPDEAADPMLGAYGLLTAAERRAVRARVMGEVVAPGADALLGPSVAHASPVPSA